MSNNSDDNQESGGFYMSYPPTWQRPQNSELQQRQKRFLLQMACLNRNYNKDLHEDLLDWTYSLTTHTFEKLACKVVEKMTDCSPVIVTQQTNDKGIDGRFEGDSNGLNRFCVEAKQYYDNAVGVPLIREFIGSMAEQGFHLGYFVTNSTFSHQAVEYVKNMRKQKRIILINRGHLLKLMIEHNVGVSVQKTYVIKQIDENYFPDT